MIVYKRVSVKNKEILEGNNLIGKEEQWSWKINQQFEEADTFLRMLNN